MLKIDNTAPVLSDITNSSNGNWASKVTLKWNITETGSGIKSVEWRLNSGTTWTGFKEAEWYGITRTNERNDTIYIRVTDNAGNISNIKSSVLKIDNTNPTAKISATVKQNNITVSANGSSDSRSGIKTYKYRLDNGQWYSSTSTSYTFSNVSVGSHTVYVQVVDNAGRSSTTVSTNKTIASDNIIYDTGTTNYSYKKLNPMGGIISLYSSYIYFDPEYNKTLSFTQAFSNNYRYLKITARAIKSSTYGEYYGARFGVQSQPTSDNDGVVSNVLLRYIIIDWYYSDKLENYNDYTTFTLDLSSVNASSYYVFLNNCDSKFYIQKVWLTNTA